MSLIREPQISAVAKSAIPPSITVCAVPLHIVRRTSLSCHIYVSCNIELWENFQITSNSDIYGDITSTIDIGKESEGVGIFQPCFSERFNAYESCWQLERSISPLSLLLNIQTHQRTWSMYGSREVQCRVGENDSFRYPILENTWKENIKEVMGHSKSWLHR